MVLFSGGSSEDIGPFLIDSELDLEIRNEENVATGYAASSSRVVMVDGARNEDHEVALRVNIGQQKMLNKIERLAF